MIRTLSKSANIKIIRHPGVEAVTDIANNCLRANPDRKAISLVAVN